MTDANSDSMDMETARRLRMWIKLKDGTQCEPYPVPDRVYVQWRWDETSKGKCSNEPFEGSTEYALPAVGTRTFTKADVEAGCYAAIPEPTHLYEGRAADDVAQLKLAAGIDRLAFRSRLIAALSALGEVEG